MKGAVTLVAENRFLQSFCAVAASSVLVSGTLFLLTTTAPWTPPELAIEPSPPDATPSFLQAAAPHGNAVPPASDQSELSPAFDSAGRSYLKARVRAAPRRRTTKPTAPSKL